MEELDDINDGQSHRRALNEQFAGRRPMLQLSGPQFNSPPSVGRTPCSPNISGPRWRPCWNKPPRFLWSFSFQVSNSFPLQTLQTNQNRGSRTFHRGGIVKTNNQRSVTVGARLDPALNENNDDIDPQARGSGQAETEVLIEGERGRHHVKPPCLPRPPHAQRPLSTYVDWFCYVSMLISRSVRTWLADYPTPHRSYRL